MMYDVEHKLTDITSDEGYDELLRFGAGTARFGHHILVQHLHGALETRKLYHGVGDLTQPQRIHTFVKPIRKI